MSHFCIWPVASRGAQVVRHGAAHRAIVSHLYGKNPPDPELCRVFAWIEREAILRTLEAVGGSTSRAAALLQISARKIHYKLKGYQDAGVISSPQE